MKNTIRNYLNRLKKDRNRQRKMGAILVCLSLAVALSVTWSLHMTGESRTAETWCGYTEHEHDASCEEKTLVCGYDTEEAAQTASEQESAHTHTDACYNAESALACGYDTEETAQTASEQESAHTHTDACYETAYICGMEEHQHQLSCFSNPDADVETAADWEKTFDGVELTGVYADDLPAIAKTQLGYTESAENYQVALDAAGNETEEINGYTRYGAWYGTPYGGWDALFVSFCLNYAKIPADVFPQDADCGSWTETLAGSDYGLYEAAADYSPYPGDLVFFDTDGDAAADHVGIVSGLTPEYTGTEESYEDDADYTLSGFKAIEGGRNDKVEENEYSLTDETILGYGRMPENPQFADGESGDGTDADAADAGNGTDAGAANIGDGTDADAAESGDGTDAGAANTGDGTDADAADAGNETDAGAANTGDGTDTVTADAGNGVAGAAAAYGNSVVLCQIDEFKVVFTSGGKLTTVTNTDNEITTTDSYYVWDATDSASGHEFVYRVDYTTSGVGSIPAGKFVITLPLHMLKDENGNWADKFDCAYLNEDEIASGDSPTYAYQIDEENNCVYIYNYSEIPTGNSGFIEFSYTTTETTYNYEDLGVQTETLVAKLEVGSVLEEVNEEKVETEVNKWADYLAAGINIDTGVAITSTKKQTPTRYTSWLDSSWTTGEDKENGTTSLKPENDTENYYFVWPIYTVVGRGTQRYDLTLTDTFTDFDGEVIAYRFSGSGDWVAADENGSATVTGLTPTDTSGRYDYVLVSCSKEKILEYLKTQYPEDVLADVTTLEEAEDVLFKSGEYTLKYTVNNKIEAMVTPADGKDEPTSASGSNSYTYEVPPYENPVGIFYADKWGIYHSSSRVYNSEDISSYKLSEFLSGNYGSIDGLKYYTYVDGYPGRYTLKDGAEGTAKDAIDGNYFQKSVVYSLADSSFSLNALTYDSSYHLDGMYISGEEQALEAGDYDLTSLEWNLTAQTAVYDEKNHTWKSSAIRDFSSNDANYESTETGYDSNTLYFDVYVVDSEHKNGDWLAAAAYDLKTGEYITNETEYPGAAYIDQTKLTSSGAGGTIPFNKELKAVKGYKIEMANPFYYTKIGAYPTISLNRTDHVAQILLGSDEADKNDLETLASQEPQVLSKIAVTNKSTGTVEQTDNGARGSLFVRNASGRDYVSALVRNATLSKRVTSTLNDKRNRQYEISWSVTLKETYTDDTGDHTVPQESGTFYDLLPAGGILDPATVKVTSSSGTLNSGEYELEEIDNYKGYGRTMMKVTIYEPTSNSYTLSYTTSHSWDAVKDYGKKVLNSAAYETGNDDIGDGKPDNGGKISESNLMSNLTETTDDDESPTEKFLFTETSWSINNLVAANTGLMKQVKASGDAEYSYSTVVSAGGTYSYQIRFANDSLTASDDIMLFDSLEYFHQDYDENDTEAGNPAIESDWEGALTGIDESQLEKKFTKGYTIYVSDVDDLNFYELAGTTAESGKAGELGKDYDFESDVTKDGIKIWYTLANYLSAHQNDLSSVHAVAIDARGNRLEAGDSVTYTLYMKAPATATDKDYEDGANNDTPYPDPVTYNNIYVSRTALKVTVDEKTGEQTVDTENPSENFFHQDFTQVRFRPTGDVLLKKVNEYDTEEPVSGATYLLSGTSDYGTVYELTAASAKNGLISFTDIETGTYTLKEISCSSDWLLNKEEYTVTIKASSDGVVVTLDGYGFPDSDGDLKWDTEEVNGQPRYLLTDEPRIYARLSFGKTDSITGRPVEGAEFKLYGESYYGTDILLYAASDSSGTVTFEDVERGDSYTLVESSPPEGYIPVRTVWKVTVDKQGLAQIYEVGEDGTQTALETSGSGYQVENEPYHNIQFVKKSTYGKDNYIEGIEFKLSGTSDYGNYYEQTAKSGSSYGLVEFRDLEPGSYELVETDTSGAKDNSYDEDKQTNGQKYPVDSHKYTVVVKADGTYTISGLGQEKIDIYEDGAGEDFYVFQNTPENGVITVTKVWLDGEDDSSRTPGDLDITVSTSEPDASSHGGTSITFDANGGYFPDGGASRKIAYVGTTIMGTRQYDEPDCEGKTFADWYTDPECSGDPVTVDAETGYPLDASGDPITPDTTGQTLWTPTDNNGWTLTLYAKFEDEPYNMKYAVRLYGIQSDVGEDNEELGLTFGPATGEDYRTLKTGDTGEDKAEYGSGSGYVAHISKKEYKANKDSGGEVCLHWMTWSEIAEQSKDNPHAFDACLENGCTHSVKVDVNKELLDTSTSGFTQGMIDMVKANWNGDGAGMFYWSINSEYLKWNQSNNYGGWATSRVRYTLNGWNETDDTTYSGTEYLCTPENSLLSCFETDLQTNIAAAKKLSNRGYSVGLAETSDKLWLFSRYELTGESGYDWFVDGEIAYEDRKGDSLVGFSEKQDHSWLSRSARSYGYDSMYCVNSDGSWSIYSIASYHGLAPGFCIK